MEPMTFSAPDIAKLLTLFARQVRESGFIALSAANAADFAGLAGAAVLFFADDPKRVPECWDVAVVLPDIVGASAEPLRVGLLDPASARELAARYGVIRWPSLVFLRDGAYLGVIERMRDWDEFRAEIRRILALAPSAPPPALSSSASKPPAAISTDSPMIH
jgi:hydrogenase-1 operon protein HyaE